MPGDDMDWLYAFLLKSEEVGPVLFRAGHQKTGLEYAIPKSAAAVGSDSLPKHALSPQLINRMNRAALSQLRYGQVTRAELLCHKMIELCKEVLHQGHPLWWARGMIDPYINLGRLAALKGETDLALGIYKNVYRLGVEAADIQIDGYEVPVSRLLDSLRTLMQDDRESVFDQAGTIFVAESFRALLTAGRVQEAYEFALSAPRWMTGSVDDSCSLVHELCVLGALAVGAYDDAQAWLAKVQWDGRGADWTDITKTIMAAELSFWGGDSKKAVAQWNKSSAMLNENPANHGLDINNRLYLYIRTAFGLFANGTLDGLESLLEQILEYATTCGNEVHSLRCLMLLAQCEAMQGRKPSLYRERLRSLAVKTNYRLDKAVAFFELFRTGVQCESPDATDDLLACYALAESIGSIQANAFIARIQEHCGSFSSLLALDSRRKEWIVNKFRCEELEQEFTELMDIQLVA
jgi:tetratricopeptide (TPR) repeat protein